VRLLVLMAGCALALAACSRQEPAASDASQAPAAKAAAAGLEPELHILAWSGAAERGGIDPRVDWVTPFEAETGCKVNVTLAGVASEMISVLAAGGQDIVTASGDIALELVRSGLVEPVDVTRIPGYATLDDRLERAAWLYVDGKHYGVPYLWGPNVLLYDTRVFPTPPTSWAVIFEPQTLPDGKPNQGRVQGYDAPIYLADAALYLRKKRPDLGIEDPYALNDAQRKAALAVLEANRRLAHSLWDDANSQVQAFTRDGVVASASRAFQANTLVANKAPVASTIPSEGATAWSWNTLVAANAAHPKCAHRWLEWTLSRKVQGDAAAFNGANPVVPDACQGHSKLDCQKNGFASFDSLHFWRTPETQCPAQGPARALDCALYESWSLDFAKLPDTP
jgi:putative spermidine/putrescine transport system substrate-binding protein